MSIFLSCLFGALSMILLGMYLRLRSAVKRLPRDWDTAGPRCTAELSVAVQRVRSESIVNQTALNAANAQLEALFNQAPIGLLSLDINTQISRINQTAAKILGTPPEDAAGKLFCEVARQVELEQLTDSALATQSTHSADNIRIGTRGTTSHRIVSATAFPVRPDQVYLVLLDLTRLYQLERVRQDFVVNASHEIKTPVSAIKAAIETYQMFPDNNTPTQTRCVEIIAGQAQRLETMVSDLLTLSLAENAAMQHGDLTHIRILDLFQTARDACEVRLSTRDNVLDIQCDENLSITGHPFLLEQVFINLIDNASKYSPEGTQIFLSARSEGDMLIATVADKGPGIASHHLPRLFERFYRTDKARSRDMGGTGLGLSIVKHIVDMHHGKISVNSKLQEGTTFTIELPLQAESSS